MHHSERVLFLFSLGIRMTDLKTQDCLHTAVNTHTQALTTSSHVHTHTDTHTLLSRFTGSLEFSQLSGEDLWDVAITYLNYAGI